MLFLSTQSLFVALGGSTAKAQLGAAAYTWVLTGGMGQVGLLLFAAKFAKYFDEDNKKWRFMAAAFINFGIYLEISTLAFPGQFLILASISAALKNITYLLFSASR